MGVLFHPEFVSEFDTLTKPVKQDLLAHLHVLEQFGPGLGRPLVDTLKGAVNSNLKELRFRSGAGVWRFAFAFDPKRQAILLAGGDKGGIAGDQFYSRLMKRADDRFTRHLETLEAENEKPARRNESSSAGGKGKSRDKGAKTGPRRNPSTNPRRR